MRQPLFKIRQNGFYGFINATGEVVIEPQYLEAGEFHNGFARVRLNDQWVPMDALGRLLLKRIYRDRPLRRGPGPGAGGASLGVHRHPRQRGHSGSFRNSGRFFRGSGGRAIQRQNGIPEARRKICSETDFHFGRSPFVAAWRRPGATGSAGLSIPVEISSSPRPGMNAGLLKAGWPWPCATAAGA
jgi:hypothetical protein